MTLKDFADLANSIGIILGVPLLLYGIDAWRREAMWKRRSELCEEVLALCYETKEIVRYMRSPGALGGEGESRKRGEGESEQQTQKMNTAWIPIERFNRNREKLSRLWSLSYRFRAQFGIEKTQPIDDLRDAVDSVLSAARILATFWTELKFDVMTPEQRQGNMALVRKYEGIFWEGLSGEQPDEIQKKVDGAIHEMEKTCREVLHAQHTLFGFLNAQLSSLWAKFK